MKRMALIVSAVIFLTSLAVADGSRAQKTFQDRDVILQFHRAGARDRTEPE